MRRSKMLAAAAVSACLTLGSVSTSWAWWYTSSVKGEEFTMKSSEFGEIDLRSGILGGGLIGQQPVHIYKEWTGGLWYFKNDEKLMIYPDGAGRRFVLNGYLADEDGGITFNGDVDGYESLVNPAYDIRITLSDSLDEPTRFDIYQLAKAAAEENGRQPEDYRFCISSFYYSEETGSESGRLGCYIQFVNGSASFRTDGTWAHDSKGWWIQYPDGTYMVNDWYRDPADGHWYRMGADGYMLSNAWYKAEGSDMYFYLAGDGHMLENTWFQDPGSGLWYYLGAAGNMLRSTHTPDGLEVDADGVWVQ